MPENRRNASLDQHCREVIRDCLNIVDQHSDTYVAIHKDDDTECVILVTMLRSYPIISIIVADKLLFADVNTRLMYQTANELNEASLIGWHSLMTTDDSLIYMYRQCIWQNLSLNRDEFIEMLCESIAEYKRGRAKLTGEQY